MHLSTHGIIIPTATASFTNTNSCEFDGTDDCIISESVYTELNGDAQATIMAWIKPVTGGATLRFVFQIGRGSTGLNCQVEMWLYEGNRIQADLNSSGVFIRGDISSITYGSWNHIALALDGSQSTNADKGKIFVNGTDVTSSQNLSSFSTLGTATDELYVGETKTGHYNPFNGKIDEFAIWSGTRLTDSNITDIYNSGTPADLSSYNPTTWWRMGDDDGASGVTITDQGSASIDGTLTNGTTFTTDVP